MVDLKIENEFRTRVMAMSFANDYTITSKQDITAWRESWTKALSAWHTPYKALIDCRNLHIIVSAKKASDREAKEKEIRQGFRVMIAALKGFFLKNAIGYGYIKAQGHDILPFEVYPTKDQASEKLGIRPPRVLTGSELSLREAIALENRFAEQVVEVTFRQLSVFKDKKDIELLRSKLTNNLMQWHSSWNLLVDCGQLEIDRSLDGPVHNMEKALKGFFLKQFIGYNPKTDPRDYPFKVYRSRHKALAQLQIETDLSQGQTNCVSRQNLP